VVLTGGDVTFRPDSADLLDPAAASATLEPIARKMISGGLRATLTGTTADVGDEAGQRQLSRQRAQAVLDLLVGLHVPAGRMTAVGLGSDFPGYVRDHDRAGHLVPWAAAANRKVTVQLLGGRVTC
jgi:outer membrane protein OmpA-like peptidoglycan-associated protein